MVIDSRRILSGFAVFALVLMRLVIGWHFFGEGTKKLEYDRQEKQFRVVFSADKEFLDLAKGPLAPLYQGHTLSNHEWRAELASPRENARLTTEQVAEQTKWAKEYAQRRADAKKSGQAVPVEFPAHTASQKWAEKIAEDWRTAVNRFTAIAGVTEAQKQEAENALSLRLDELAEYIRGVEPDIAEYRHELWRLANWRQAPEAGDMPFQKQRITLKAGETTAAAAGWKGEVEALEDGLSSDLNAILTSEQRGEAATVEAVEHALADPNQHKLDFVNKVAMAVTIGVGACLILGFFTRLAAIVGALFLLGVIASQPFWISGTAPTINQCVEFTALLVLAGTGAGRWAGMDGCLAALFRRRRALVVQENS
jgi:uncharacterized membrane protein YphA (DoxX/SURF4 family)